MLFLELGDPSILRDSTWIVNNANLFLLVVLGHEMRLFKRKPSRNKTWAMKSLQTQAKVVDVCILIGMVFQDQNTFTSWPMRTWPNFSSPKKLFCSCFMLHVSKLGLISDDMTCYLWPSQNYVPGLFFQGVDTARLWNQISLEQPLPWLAMNRLEFWLQLTAFSILEWVIPSRHAFLISTA